MTSVKYKGKLLDRYLACGWYRMEERMFTCRYSFYPWGFLTTVWTRLPLKGHVFSKRIRKLIRKNENRFQVRFHPAQAGEDEERVFAAYAESKEYDLKLSANSYLQDGAEYFNTWQASVFDDGTLVAFSYFDVGEKSVQSISGFFDPEYYKYSLGLYTMVLEILLCKEWQMDFHYSGYIVPGNDIFEYKRRVGDLEAFDDVAQQWYPIAKLDESDLPDAHMRSAMMHYDKLYSSLKIDYTVVLSPQYHIDSKSTNLQWIRKEQLPFAITDRKSNRRPYWACHFYSYNYNKYFSMLCKEYYYGSLTTVAWQIMTDPKELKNKKFVHLKSGIAISLIHQSEKPYTLQDLEKVWEIVDEKNRSVIK